MPPLDTAQEPSGQQAPLSPTAALKATAERADNCVFFFDFDGTLAPIQDDPNAVQVTPGVLEAISELAARVRRVSLVSARPVDFLRSRFPDVPLTLHGLYGLESQYVPGKTITYPPALPFADLMTELARRAERELPDEVLVEFKRLSVALHYRSAPELRDAVHAWAQDQASRHGLREQEGRMVIELKPSVQRDKGSVVAEEIEDFSCAWYFGDDLGDLAAFRALAVREAADPNFLGVRVAVRNPETGAEVAAAADLHLEGPAAVPAFLREALTLLPRRDKP
ncbi:trehalose-phosphatase [Planosporangium flavigriseum]|uniref:Trehalose 6-phosphate phosphatase n=1 Tax=Planosporangium flavigriseum TaxID=373681 RepID=A0A8J3LKD3_9ACTN|nr:trehalose-phosphatase [Planosporangium flavigriseum]NJC63459.1 trehalose-phosphatase [Planosporangium flavigriseum]GIG72155.1 trehalose 6-phosphate phosphatase [Planosporangium flavigriseum]